MKKKYTDIALRLRDRFFEGELTIVVPELMFSEVSNAMSYNGVLSMSEKLGVIDDLFSINTTEVLFISELR